MKSNLQGYTKTLFLSLLASVLTGCISSGPQTEYYSLFSNGRFESTVAINEARGTRLNQLKHGMLSIGVGPITLPEYAQKSSVVSFTQGNKLRIAGYHAWVDGLEKNITRVMAANLNESLNTSVTPFPWSRAIRPDTQLLIRFSEIGGERGKFVSANIEWSLVNIKTQVKTSGGALRNQQALNNDSVAEYVAGMNRALNQLSDDLAKQLSK